MKLTQFDKIWCLHCVDHTDRELTSLYEFNKIGIGSNVEYRWTSLQPNVNLLQADKLNHLRSEGEYHCTREHYTMIKIAYNLGYKYILVFEDDVKCIKKSLWNQFMNNIPDDFDILRLGGYIGFQNPNQQLFDQGKLWEKLTFSLWSTTAYALSRNGMKYYLDYVEEKYCVADWPLYDIHRIDNLGLKCYISTIPLVYYYKFDSAVQPNNDFDFKDIFYRNTDLELYN